MILALTAQSYWELFHLDAKTVFLNEKLQEKVYMTQPKGFVVVGQESSLRLETSTVCLVLKDK